MGVPKFFRYISERYPCLSELVKEYQIPDFDNLYLDMNGIIHMCSHPDDNNPHFRITEEKIFKDVFHYIEVLFRMIRPRKLFFMAVDGVAPRAKMNQQRGRRFRAAKDAMKQEEQARKKGETLPSEARFDSNCITPGTVFMARLHEQLKYFVVEKISSDPLWQKCKVILSGHETPGEGEHKIMDYIRYMRSQPNYDPNTRHCLYGLDADLIMLGLCTHEPHFSLLREEVKFGKKSTAKRQSVPEEITFFLLHLSLMRDYLELEFAPVKEKLIGFEYDLEKIIDDWVLMGFLVGNDFIPNLPNLHIANGALPILYKAYMEVLPTLDGYINEGGTLNLSRFEKFMQNLGNIDIENFEEVRDDLLYMEAKTGRKCTGHPKVSSGRVLEQWEDEDGAPLENLESLEPEKAKDSGLAALIQEANDMCLASDESGEESEDDYDAAFTNYKKDYYRNKLEYANVTPEVMRSQAEGYVRAIQWNLNYYYNGVCSWSWYYPHHYSPYISDIKGFTNLKLDYDLGKPFKPYEQLLAVLPSLSKNLLPEPYHHLMTDENSMIKHFYPEDFDTDLNGKKQEWEAVVLIPFLDEKLLLDAMRPCNDRLSAEEKQRNSHGPMLVYTYTGENLGEYPAPEYFPAVPQNHAKLQKLTILDILVPRDKLVKGAYPGAQFDVYYPGFPTFKHLKYEAMLRKAGVKVFEQPSRFDNMIITIIPDEKYSTNKIPVELLETCVFVGWPHLTEAKVVAISNNKQKYISQGGPNQYNIEDKTENMVAWFKKEGEGVIQRYKNRMGIICGDAQVLVHVKVLIGKKYVAVPDGKLVLQKQFSENTANYPLQTIVTDIKAHVDDTKQESVDMFDLFEEGSTVFTLTNPYYGSQGTVINSKESIRSGRLKICISVTEEPDLSGAKQVNSDVIRSYKTLHNISSHIGMSNHMFSRITGTIFISARNGEGGLKSINIGLDLKFNKKNKETPGYTRKIGPTWYYTDKACELVKEYAEKFPEVFQYLSEHDNNDDNMTAEGVFGDDCDERLKELQTWLRTIPTHDIERQPCGCSTIEPEAVKEIENVVDKYVQSAIAKKITMQIKPAFLYKPELQTENLIPDEKMTVKLYDRIVNVRNGFSVPFGLKGTIIAIKQSTDGSDRDTMYDVVFDRPFKDGLELNCSPGRGYRLPKTAFIDITHGFRLLEEKSLKPSVGNTTRQFVPTQVQRQQHLQKSTQLQQQYQQQQQQQQLQQQTSFAPPPPMAPTLPVLVQGSPVFYPGPQGYGGQQPPAGYPQPPFGQEQSAFASFVNSGGNQRSAPHGFFNNRQQGYAQNTNNIRHQQQPVGNHVQNKPDWQHPGGNNSFMSDFLAANKPQNQRQDDTAKRELPKRQEETPNDVPKPERRATVNTDFLKSILKIGENHDNKENQARNNRPNQSPRQNNVKNSNTFEIGSNVSFEMLAQVAQAPASVRLLTYYQSNGLGVPRYQYFKSDYNEQQAQITLPTGELITGAPAASQEEASENVASEALEILMKKAKFKQEFPAQAETIPTPPSTWVKPQKHNTDGRHETTTVTTNTTTDSTKSKTDTAVLDTPFVPLQAIKRHISKTTSGNIGNGSSEGGPEEEVGAKEAEQVGRSKQQPHRTALARNDKKPTPRKPRIAAKFVKT